MPRHTLRSAAAYCSVILLVPLLVGALNLASKMREVEPPQPPAYTRPIPVPPAPDPSKKVAVVLSSAYGAEITDSLPTFEILATSGAFNTYVVAPERTVLPLVNSNMQATSLDFIPHFSYADYEARIGTPPDVIAIPWFPGYTSERDSVVLDWIRSHTGPNTTILTICAGTEILADTGLLDGRTATTNTQWFSKLEERVPTATWVRNVRYYDNGNIVTSTNLASGIDATLHVVDKLVGRSSALDVARQIGYTHTAALDDPRFEPPATLSFVVPLVANTAFARHEQLGVLLYDGASELGLAGLLDPTMSSLASRAYLMAPERTTVRSRHGLDFVPRYDFGSVPALDRVLVPAGSPSEAKAGVVASWSQARPGRPAADLFEAVGHSETAYDATLKDIAQRQSPTLAKSVGTGLFYPFDELQPGGVRPAIGEVLTPLALSLAGALGVFATSRLLRARPSTAAG